VTSLSKHMSFTESYRQWVTVGPVVQASSAEGVPIPDSVSCPKTIQASNSRPRTMSRIARFAWVTLGCNLAVVLWGAYVRATGSGDGCSNRWPVCNGDVLGASAKASTIVEFTHRMTSAVSLLMVIFLAVWCWRATSRRNWARYSVLLATAFLANEALLGAALVLLKYVGHDQSAGRIVFLSLHLGNTLLLLATLSLTATWLSNSGRSFIVIRKWRELTAIGMGLLATMITGITGAVTALADTLLPATSLRSSLLQDFSTGTPALSRFRLLHPAVAVLAACYVLWVIFRSSSGRNRFSPPVLGFIALLFLQVGIGMMNVLLLVPVWLQIVHLFVADVLWILLVLMSADLVLEPTDVNCDRFTR